jgi:hypothetical protein
MPLSDRIILEVAWVGDNDLLVKEVDRAARKGSVVIFEAGRNEGVVTRVLGQEGEEGDDGWIDHVCFPFVNSIGLQSVDSVSGGYLISTESKRDPYSWRYSGISRCRPDERRVPAHCSVCACYGE